MKNKILLCEDDKYLRDGLCELLQKEGYAVDAAESTVAALRFAENNYYNLIILDVMLPDGNGVDVCRNLRESGNTTPVLFLTACDDEIQVVQGLDAGGDDYVTKPFKLLELLSRVRALLRRSNISVYKSGGIAVDVNAMTVRKDGKVIFVTPTELQILFQLLRNNGAIVKRADLLQSIWDDGGEYIDDNTLSVHISRLRDKIGAEHIKTIRGIGYRWEERI